LTIEVARTHQPFTPLHYTDRSGVTNSSPRKLLSPSTKLLASLSCLRVIMCDILCIKKLHTTLWQVPPHSSHGLSLILDSSSRRMFS